MHDSSLSRIRGGNPTLADVAIRERGSFPHTQW